jgi:4-hydroxyphenylpyruvate dioxygenase
VRLVPISANYYDDLLARQSLAPAVVERMRAAHIVFDASATGTYFQAYAESFDDRFYLEIVQRNGYDGYGAVNAPARLAAIEQLLRP